ncbi:TetR family transcriptional regulator [Streptantibioticus ferralitis]|uniref:TetR family transcriptional regulator n=1 Tax=Streptantibioticus ferralitis TaxID=236510 RepID=A0ABT5Z2G2_9ACTN|nr:TetR family transcriptional regulator [Streptantibioticus ferralitis]MDF2257984.1 TetR family transcriptional regulator [Streptantibioticus ferralitis]
MTDTVATAQPAPGASGLRARKKQRTRDALTRAAMELFTTQGFEHTTVDEIADAVEVSQRTFFRYFSNKEQAALALEDLIEERFMASLRERPATETPLEALRQAVLGTWDDISAAIHEVVPIELYMRMYQVIESTPALLSTRMRRQSEMEQRITAEIARREGLDPVTDLRPRVLVAAVGGVIQAASGHWGQCEDDSVEQMRRSFDEHLTTLTPALTGQWRTPGA